METLKDTLIRELRKIDGFEDRPSPVAGGTALFYRGKDLAHFHNDRELDLRLTKTLIRECGLAQPTDSTVHPGRSANSPWIEIRFANAAEVKALVGLAKLAITAL